MSGIYIPMKPMPKCCGECSFCIECGGYHYCTAAEFTLMPKEYLDTKHAYCPLIPVPDHGRLIDADALAEEHRVRAHQGMIENSYSVHTIAKAWVDEAPTIIPADKEDGE